MTSDHTLPFSELFHLRRFAAPRVARDGTFAPASFPLNASQPQTSRDAASRDGFHIAARKRDGRWVAASGAERDNWRVPLPMPGGWWALPRASVGDAPDKYHPAYAMALLSARLPMMTPRENEVTQAVAATPDADKPPHEYSCAAESNSLNHWPVPIIDFSTAPEVRRSMTLNGMRMTIEYTQTASLRVLQLVESRLQAGQRDVVHDVLVYVMRQIIDARRNQAEARDLRAESVAAYLGLDELKVRMLFANSRLSARLMARRIEEGFAGSKRRNLDVETLLRGQIAHLRPDLLDLKRREDSLLWLLDEIVARLFAHGESTSCLT